MGKPKVLQEYVCSKCKKKYKDRQGLHRHKSICLLGIKFKCDQCSKLFTGKDSLKDHAAVCNKGKKNTKCEICQHEFPYEWNLERHIKQKHIDKEKKDFTCNNCGKKYERENFYSGHLLKCTGR